MALSKRAKILTEKQEASVLQALDTNGRYTLRNRGMFLLSVKAGLRAKEIALLTWSMVTDAEGQIADAISIENKASKGKRGGRTIPMNQQLKKAVEGLQAETATPPIPECPVIRSERGRQAAAGSNVAGVDRGLVRGTSIERWVSTAAQVIAAGEPFITRAARKISAVGGSLRDVQFLAGMQRSPPRRSTLTARATRSAKSSI